jgi:hypothetical protein
MALSPDPITPGRSYDLCEDRTFGRAALRDAVVLGLEHRPAISRPSRRAKPPEHTPERGSPTRSADHQEPVATVVVERPATILVGRADAETIAAGMRFVNLRQWVIQKFAASTLTSTLK